MLNNEIMKIKSEAVEDQRIMLLNVCRDYIDYMIIEDRILVRDIKTMVSALEAPEVLKIKSKFMKLKALNNLVFNELTNEKGASSV